MARSLSSAAAFRAALVALGSAAALGSAIHIRQRSFLYKDPELPSFYHTSDEIAQELQALAADCPGLSIETKTGDNGEYNVGIDVATFRKPGASEVSNKFFLLFGEHARELISPESSLHFLQTLCGKNKMVSQEKVDKVLANSEFQVVVNGNPNSRKRVEEGNFCLRVNGQGVDLNRNWDEKWVPQEQDILQSPDTNPGPKAFSEPETRIFKSLVSEYQPTSFLTVHSGTKGMYMPWAYDMEHLAKKNGKAMFNMLKKIDKEYCQCPFGAAGKEVGYECPGTCLDYVYDHQKVEYSFAFEIYTWKQDWNELEARFEQKMAQPSDFFQTNMTMAAAARNDQDFQECFARFNPSTQPDFEETLDTWTNVYLDLAQDIAMDIKEKGL